MNRSDGRAAARLAARTWSPFPEPGLHLVDGAKGICAWAWNPVQTAGGAIPCALLQAPGADGFRLIRQPDCFEGQQWTAGELLASAWWPDAPNAEAWRQFQRAAGVPIEQQTAPPAAVAPVWLKTAFAASQSEDGWTNQLPDELAWLSILNRPVFRWGALFGVAFGIGLVAADAVRAWRDLADATFALSQEEVLFQAVRADRDVAIALSSQNQTLAIGSARGSPLRLMAAVSAALPEQGARLLDWFQQSNDLNASLLASGAIDSAALVRRLEAIPDVAGVTLDGASGAEERVVRLRLTFTP